MPAAPRFARGRDEARAELGGLRESGGFLHV